MSSLPVEVSRSVRVRLMAMMLLQYFALGAWQVTISTYFLTPLDHGGLGLSSYQVGWLLSTFALGGMVSTLFTGLLADRLFRADRVMAMAHLVGGCLLLVAAWLCVRRHAELLTVPTEQVPLFRHRLFLELFALLLLNALAYTTTMTLSNVVAFRNLSDPKHQFGPIRLFGTIGWMLAGWIVGFFLNAISPGPLFLAGSAGLVLAGVCVLLPVTPPLSAGRSLGEAMGIPALRLFRVPAFRAFAFTAVAITIIQTFFNAYFNKYLHDIDAPWPAAVQTIAQATEVVCMLLVPWGLKTFGERGLMMIGIAGWSVRYAIFATLSVPLALSIGLPLHGMSYAFFYMVAAIYIDEEAPPHLRASAQAIVVFLTLGVSNLLGNVVAASVKQIVTQGAVTDWCRLWTWPAVAATAILLYFALAFRPHIQRELS